MPSIASLSPEKVAVLIGQARHALGFSQKELGEQLGAARRTAARWEWGKSTLSTQQTITLARLVHPRDAAIATALAAQVGQTLESLGLVVLHPPAAAQPPAPPALPPPPRALVVDAVVCVAADALAVPPAAVRSALYAAFQRARQLQLTLEDVESALAPTREATKEGKVAKATKAAP
jgi:DNA-binding XRE family transcriptional regulator